jgi:HlyD family secretion protein
VVHRRLKDLPDTPLFRDWIAKQPKTPSEKGKDDAVRYVTIVFVLDNGVARARPVQTGISDQERIEILGGITPEEEVIVGPFRTLDEMVDGQPVKPEEPKPVDTETASGDVQPAKERT